MDERKPVYEPPVIRDLGTLEEITRSGTADDLVDILKT